MVVNCDKITTVRCARVSMPSQSFLNFNCLWFQVKIFLILLSISVRTNCGETGREPEEYF